MEKNTNASYLSDDVQNCLCELFSNSYKDTDKYIEAIVEVSNYLISNSKQYDEILNKYNNINKDLLKQMILSNFLEITYYRRKIGIPIDDKRLGILTTVYSSEHNENEIMNLIYVDIYQFTKMINDVLLYLWHPSLVYSYNVVKSMAEDDFCKKLYSIYPLAMQEHALTLDYTFTEKEFLFHTLIEIIINASEKIIFSNDDCPYPDRGYFQKISNILKKYNGTNPSLPNVHKEILEEYNSRILLSKGINYNKILILEILFTIINLKSTCYIPASEDEKYILNKLQTMDITIENISEFYDDNEMKIISNLINNWNMFEPKSILTDTDIFRKVKQKNKT